MDRYLHLFEIDNDRITYEEGDEYVEPYISFVESDDSTHYNKPPHDYSQDYFTIKALEDGTVSFTMKAGIGTSSITTVSYSTDNGENWTSTEYQNSAITINVNVSKGDKVLWKGDAKTFTYNPRYPYWSYFSSTCNMKVVGNIMSLLYGEDFIDEHTLEYTYTFYALFSGATKLISAENLILPATTLAQYCYCSMFYDCTSLTSVPQLPATTLANSCYQQMFQGCTSLTSAPQLPATTLAQSCYWGICQYCTGLTSAPELPATTLANSCYNNMFVGCTSLITAPQLPATTLTEYCYSSMFNGCTNLNYIKAMFTTTPSTTYTQNWVKGVAASGTFVKNSAATWTTTGVNGVPNGWTVQRADS